MNKREGAVQNGIPISQHRRSHHNPQLPGRGLCAHRGAMATHPENTLPAFRKAILCGAHMIEFDVQLTKDNALVVMHDPTVDRTSNGHGAIAALTLEEIQQLDAGSWKSPVFQGEKVPTLDEVLSIMPVNIWLNIHLKGGETLGRQTALHIRQQQRLHQAFLACDIAAAEGARAVVPEIMICNMEKQGDTRVYVEETCRLESHFIQLSGSISPIFREYITVLKENNIRINYFGTDDPEELRALFAYGVEFPLVNNVCKCMNVATELGMRPVQPVYPI
jgi:glycerophosphoryl diester phosphodiesterase